MPRPTLIKRLLRRLPGDQVIPSPLAESAAALVAAGSITVPRLRFVRVPPEMVRGGYPIGKHTPNGMPLRALFVHPEVWPDFIAVADRIVVTDLTRSAEASLSRMAEKPGLVQPPGYSDHGCGGAFDLDIKATIKHGGFHDRAELDQWCAENGWPMFWWYPGSNAPPPNKPGSETWHHSYDETRGGVPDGRNTAAMAERRMLRWYPWLDVRTWTNRPASAQYMLARLGHYHGAIDGKFGPLSTTALAMFQRALQVRSWCRKKGVTDFAEGKLDAATARVLAFCAAEREMVKP